MNPAHPRNERAPKHRWAQNGVISPLGSENHYLICWACGASPETWSLDSERAPQTLYPKPKTQFPSHIYQKYGEHCFDRILGPTMCQSELTN